MATSIALATAARSPGASTPLAATSRTFAHAVTAVRIRGAGRDIRHVIAVQIFRIVVHVAVGRLVGLRLGRWRWFRFWRWIRAQSGRQFGNDSGVSS